MNQQSHRALNTSRRRSTVPISNVLSNVTGLDLGKISIADQDPGQLYTILSSDNRFIIVDGKLFVAPGLSLRETDSLGSTVPIIATEIGADGKSYNMNIGLSRIPNPKPWQNRLNAHDVNRVDGVDPLDALAIINALNADEGFLPFPRPASTLGLPDYDVDGDGTINPLDVLAIVNFINLKANGEGEALDPMPALETVDDANWLAAYMQIEEENLSLRRRRT